VIWLVAEINSHVKVVVIPICLVILAPLPGRIHFGDIVIHLTTFLPVTLGVVVDFRSICLEASLAVGLVVSVRLSSATDSQYEPASQRGCKSYSAPDFLAGHNRLPEIDFPEELVRA
jgi:hypothetical protein